MKLPFLFAAMLTFASASHGQQIYSDDVLLDSGRYYFDKSNYLNAAEFLFAYIQRNTDAYQTQSDFQSSLNSALAYSIRKSSAGTNAVIRSHVTDAAGHPVVFDPPPTFRMPYKSSFGKKVILYTGRYKCDDGGTYFIRIVNGEVWFYKESPSSTGPIVCHGSVVGDEIRATWSHLPGGSFGTLTLAIGADRRTLTVTAQTGDFGGTAFEMAN